MRFTAARSAAFLQKRRRFGQEGRAKWRDGRIQKMPLDSYTRKITLPRYRKQRKAYGPTVLDVAGRGNEPLLGEAAPAASGASLRLRLTPREIMQIKELLKRERQADSSVPSIAHLAGKYDSETMDAIRQGIRENRLNEALDAGDE